MNQHLPQRTKNHQRSAGFFSTSGINSFSHLQAFPSCNLNSSTQKGCREASFRYGVAECYCNWQLELAHMCLQNKISRQICRYASTESSNWSNCAERLSFLPEVLRSRRQGVLWFVMLLSKSIDKGLFWECSVWSTRMTKNLTNWYRLSDCWWPWEPVPF